MKNVSKYSVVNVVMCAISVTEQYGFVSKKSATVDNPSTASRIQTQLMNLDASEFSEVYPFEKIIEAFLKRFFKPSKGDTS